MQGLRRYETRTKKQYRGWVYNRAIEMLKCKSYDATVIYLCGPEDRDTPVASWKGFDRNKMLAIDIDKRCVKAMRKSGITAYHGTILEVISQFNAPIDFIHADFCSGLVSSVTEMLDMLINSPNVSPGAVISINLQRGREWWKDGDSTWSLYSQSFERYGFHGWKMQEIFNLMTDIPIAGGVDEKHRGAMAFKLFCMNLAASFAPGFCDLKEDLEDVPVYHCPVTGRKLDPINDALWLHFFESEIAAECDARFYTYRSNKVYMDSVVFKMPESHYWELEWSDEFNCDTRIKRKLAAAKAVMTMRQK